MVNLLHCHLSTPFSFRIAVKFLFPLVLDLKANYQFGKLAFLLNSSAHSFLKRNNKRKPTHFFLNLSSPCKLWTLIIVSQYERAYKPGIQCTTGSAFHERNRQLSFLLLFLVFFEFFLWTWTQIWHAQIKIFTPPFWI